MSSALAWGAVASSALVAGALLAGVRRWPSREIGLVLAFGAGALISAIGFELAGEGIEVGSVQSVAVGLGAGALLVLLVDSMIPKATRDSGRVAGLVTTLGFAVATALSSVA